MTARGGHGLGETTIIIHETISEKKSPTLKPRAAHSGYGSRKIHTITIC